MIGFFQDATLLNPVTPAKPKRFLLPLAGGMKPGTLYLGDPYTATVQAAVAVGANAVALDQTFEFPAQGSAVVYIPANGNTPASTMAIHYAGIANNVLTGVSGITTAIPDLCLIRPNIVWRSTGNIVFYAMGIDTPSNLLVSFGLPANNAASPWATPFGVAGGPLISPLASLAAGTENAIRVDLEVLISAGAQKEFTNWSAATSTFFAFQAGDNSAIPAAAQGVVALAPGYLFRRDQMLPATVRVLPTNRQVASTIPGFVIGQYRWRDQDTINAAAIVPTKWDADTTAIGIEKFQSGIGCNDDLKPLGLTVEDNSVFLNVQDGAYFDGPTRYFLPGLNVLEFHDAAFTTFVLSGQPNPGKPIFVGTWQMDSDGFFSIATNFRYAAGAFKTNGGPQFIINRKTKTVTLNQSLPQTTLFLGVLGGSGSDSFNLPIYPIASIQSMYINLGGDLGTAPLNSFSFNSDEGTVEVTSQTGGLYSKGQPVYAICNPGVAIQYETASTAVAPDQRQLPVDLNPAFSGITSGVVYLQQRQLSPSSVSLSCDKNLIDIPATYQSIIDLVAYGPVYFGGDYALLSATAYGPLNGEVVPNVEMKVVVDPTTWSGLINYQDPTQEDVFVTTGADGVVNMIYTPEADWGLTIPSAPASGTFGQTGFLAGLKQTHLANDTVVLPTAMPISEVFDGTNWLVTLYSVLDNNPIYGAVGANPAEGQIPWVTTGTPGTANYKTNGQLIAWGGSNPILPIDALDANGNSYKAGNFSGEVVALVYGQSLPTGAVTPAFFITFLQRVQINLEVVESGLLSNTILLQMAPPPLIVDNPWLIIGDRVQGLLNQYRLGKSNAATLTAPTSNQ